MTFVDTNYFLRFLLNDINDQHHEAAALFRAGALGKARLITSVIVVFELYWVLGSFYGKKKTQIIRILEDILEMRFIRFEQKNRIARALEIFAETNLELEDAYNLVFARESNVADFKTFDQKLLRRFKKLSR